MIRRRGCALQSDRVTVRTRISSRETDAEILAMRALVCTEPGPVSRLAVSEVPELEVVKLGVQP
jgi:hypothetical protein